MSEILIIENLNVKRNGLKILENINLRINRGTFNIIIGPNGGGKTTLLKTILGLIPYREGLIKIEGIDHIDFFKKGGIVGYVPQRFGTRTRFPMRVKDLLMLGMYRRRKSKSHSIFEKVEENLKLKEILNKSLQKLSHGEQQRAFVGMALMLNPSLILLDEATSATDPSTTFLIMELLKKKKEEGAAILMVSHDLSLIPGFVDNVICLKRTLVCHGLPHEALTREKLKQLYGTELEIFLHADVELKVVKRKNA